MMKNILLCGLLLSFGTAYAAVDVARTAEGKGDTKAEALQAARTSATSLYGERVRSWGSSDCSEKKMEIHRNQFDPNSKTTVSTWVCTIEFVTKD